MKTNMLFSLLILFCFSAQTIAQVIQTDSLTDPLFEKKDTLGSLHKQKGYFNNSQIGIGVRLGLPVLSISTVNGYQLSRHMSLGLGVGYTHNNFPLWAWSSWKTGKVTKSDYKVKADQINVFIEQRIFIGKQKISPIVFYIFNFGYSFCLSPEEHDVTPQVYFATYSINETTRYSPGYEYYSKGSREIYLYPLFNIGIGF